MRGPGESTKSENTADGEGKRDPECASPPCKRLKQAVLSFQSTSTLQDLTNSIETGSTSHLTLTNGFDAQETPTKQCTKSGGLVRAAPSPTNQVIVSEVIEIDDRSSGSPESSREPNINNEQSPSKVQVINGATSSPPSHPSTPKNNLNALKTPLRNKSTEKQKRKAEKEKERIEKQKLREEKEKQKLAKEQEKLEAKKKREQERLEKQAERERKEKEKQEEKERKERERLEKKEKEEKERLEKLAKKDEERKKKEDEKNAKLEEKRKMEEERRQQEEEQMKKKQKVQQAFASFFTKQVPSTPKTVPKTNDRFKPFEIKPGMTLAPISRKTFTINGIKEIDKHLAEQGSLTTYLEELQKLKPLKLQMRVLRKKVESVEPSEQDDDIIIIHDGNVNSPDETVENTRNFYRVKLLQFHENTRPPYFGTWRKKSKYISPRNPFKRDNELLDYEVDSDDEWEEEEPGESLSHSEGEDEGEVDDEDDNDGFFVPHGYLSDDEGVMEDELDDVGNTTENIDQGTMEKRKEQQIQAKVKAWEAELKKKCKPMKPVSIGCLWFRTAEMNTVLKQFTALCLAECPVVISSSHISGGDHGQPDAQEISSTTPGCHPSGMYVPEEAMPDLIRLVHGNVSGLAKLRDLFRRQWTAKCLGKTNLAEITDAELEKCPISKRQLERKIQSIATKEKRGVVDKVRWYVHRNILSTHGLDNLSVEESTPEMSSDCRQSPCQTSSLLGMPTIMQFARPSPSVTKPPSHNFDNRTSNGLDPSVQNSTLSSTTTESNASIKINPPETKPIQSVVESNNTKSKNLPTKVLSKPFVVVVDDDGGNDGGKEHSLNCKSSAENANIQETCSGNNVVTSSSIRSKITSFSEQNNGKLVGEISEGAEAMDVDG